jgi:hypothetical protein
VRRSGSSSGWPSSRSAPTKSTAGELYKYFIAKKEGVGGMPAPIQIFYPEGGGDPIVYDFGSF